MNDLVEQKNCVQILLEEERTLIPNLVDNVCSLIYFVFHDNRASHSEKKRYQYLLKKGLGRVGNYRIFKKMREFL